MKGTKKILFALGAAVILAGVLSAQEVKIKGISLRSFPEIKLILSVETNWGAPVPVDTSKLMLYEEKRPIAGLNVVPQDSLVSPIYTAIVLDKSGSMKGDAIAHARSGAVEFIRGMRGGDQAAYIVFDTRVDLMSEFTPDINSLVGLVEKTETGSDTALLDAVYQALDLQAKSPANAVKIVLALTDGRENRSQHKLDEVVEKARAASVSIYTIGLGTQIDASMLKEMAAKTEANYYLAPQPADLIDIYRRVSLLLHSQLSASFITPFPMDDKWHTLKVVIPYMGREISGEKPYLSAKESKIPAELVFKINEEQNKLQERDAQPIKDARAEEQRTFIIVLAAAALVLVLFLLLLLVRKKKR